MQRMMIIGSAGSGKSTLARILGNRFGLPVYHMDREVHWLPGWQDRPEEEKPEIVAEIVGRDAWVFEGGHSKSYGLRAARADLLVWLDMPVGLRLFRVIGRAVRDRGKTRPDMQEGCPEQLDMLPEFIRFILRTRKASRAKQRSAFAAAACPKHHLRTRRAVRDFVESV
ncbi:MAG: hypothetical protein AAGF74_04130 [Pseudomonadota bacterium]